MKPSRKKKRRAHRFRKALYSWALIVMVSALGLLLAFQYLGLSRWMGEKIQSELSAHGIEVSMRRLYIDPFGGVIAKDVKVYQTQKEKITRINVEKIRFILNWVSWWRGEPFLRRASIQNAEISFPLTQDTAVDLQKVSADVELQPKSLLIRSAAANIGPLHFDMRGTVHLNGPPPPGTPASPEEMEKRAESWRNIRREMEKLLTPIYISMEFDTSTSMPFDGKARFQIQARDVWWKNALLRSIAIQADYQNQIIKLDRLQIQLGRGEFNAKGAFQLKEKIGQLNYTSDADFTLLRSLFPKKINTSLDNLFFLTLPTCEGIFECQWSDQFSFFCRSDIKWENFSVGSNTFDHFHAMLTTDGKRFFISDLSLKNETGQMTAELLREENGGLKGWLKSSINPITLKNFFGPNPPVIFNNLVFTKASPAIDCRISGKNSDIKVEGTLDLQDFIYTNGRGTLTFLESLSSSFTFENKVLTLPDLKVIRAKNEEGSANVVYDFNTRLVAIKDGKTEINIQKFTPVFGGKLEIYVQPYRFHAPPKLEINGVVDLEEEKKTDLKIKLRCDQGMDYDFLKKTISFSRIDADMRFVSEKIHIDAQPTTTLFDGKIFGELNFDISKDETPYKVKLTVESMDFKKILTTYFNKEDAAGTCSGSFDLIGILDDMKSINGTGNIKVQKGDVYQIPVFGAFSEILSSIIPGVGYSSADSARADFVFSEGKIHINEMEIFSLAFAVIGHGTYDYIKDDVDLNMRVNVRGLIGIPLFFVSKLFEYKGKGTLQNTTWEPSIFE